MAKTRNRLLMKALEELSLVDNPANQHSTAAIFKRANTLPQKARAEFRKRFTQLLDAVTPHVKKEAQSYAQIRAVDQLWSRCNDLSSSIASILSDDLTAEKKRELLDTTLAQFRSDVQDMNVDDAAFTEDEVAKEDDATNTPNEPTGASEAPPAPEPIAAPPATAEPSAGATGEKDESQGHIMKTRVLKTFTDVAAANAHVAELTTEVNTLVEKVDTLEATVDPMAAITKGMAPAAAAAFRAQAETIAKLEANQQNAGRITKAAAIVGKTGDAADVEKVANILKSVGDDATAVEFLTGVFKNYGAMLEMVDGLELGTNEGGEEGADDAFAQIQKFADEIQKAATVPMPRAVAIAKAMDAHPELYNDSTLATANAG